jgi:Predicted nucleotide-binding protein containing TIR-like domain
VKVFIGSSSESLDHMSEIAMWLEEEKVEPVPWNLPTLFLPGENTFLKLIEISRSVDGAIFVFAEDDMVWYRADTVAQPRDNVLLEYGLFVGALGPKRAIICRRGRPKAASDLHGINWIDSSPGSIQRAKVQLRAWAQQVARTPRPTVPGEDATVAAACRSIEATSSGFKAFFRNTEIFVDFGMLQNSAINPVSSAVVLPANEFFDERCFQDARTAAGAFVARHFPNQSSELQQAVRGRLGDPLEFVEKPGRPPTPSFGVGTCVYLDRPLGSNLRIIFAAVASDRLPDGLRTDLSTIFKVIERVRCILAEERVPSVYMPLLGAGKGGVPAEVAFHTLIAALLETRCRGGGHHLTEVHVVVHAPEGHSPQISIDRTRDHVSQLLTLYYSA